MSGVEVILDGLEDNPRCPHGPTLLFSRKEQDVDRRFFACSACRDRKLCNFFLEENRRTSYNSELWQQETLKYKKGINHRSSYLLLMKIRQLPSSERGYCHTCSQFQQKKHWHKHKDHELVTDVSDDQLRCPSKFLAPLENAKKEAQFLFSEKSVATILDILKSLKYEKVICMGTPRLHEHIINHSAISSLLLDIDDRYHRFFGPLQFCWYNCFNNHFFFEDSEQIFDEFMESQGHTTLVLDPPFGGRVEPLARTLNVMNEKYKKKHLGQGDLHIFLIFPYFMEPQILNCLPNFVMLDYKVDYENHPLFTEGSKARKFGSPVRIFTNVDPSQIQLPDDGYRFCCICKRWVSQENKHCNQCNSCTSKNGRTYKHCSKCRRCVKPSWQHCVKCDRCCIQNHKCGELPFRKDCFHCKESGHKKRECPKVDHVRLHKKRKLRK